MVWRYGLSPMTVVFWNSKQDKFLPEFLLCMTEGSSVLSLTQRSIATSAFHSRCRKAAEARRTGASFVGWVGAGDSVASLLDIRFFRILCLKFLVLLKIISSSFVPPPAAWEASHRASGGCSCPERSHSVSHPVITSLPD